jgi:serine/threonine-protein kinase HipA
MADFRECAKSALLKRGRAEAIVEEVRAAALRWLEFAGQAKVERAHQESIQKTLRLTFAEG